MNQQHKKELLESIASVHQTAKSKYRQSNDDVDLFNAAMIAAAFHEAVQSDRIQDLVESDIIDELSTKSILQNL